MNLKNRILKLVVRSIGRLSDGIQMALDEGLTSGRMLDYIYRNEPSGRFLVGKWIDRLYLAHPGWEAVRTRKKHLEHFLEKGINRALETSESVLIVDVASGPASYVLETLARYKDADVRAVCRDLEERWLLEGRRKAGELGIDAATFERGDALDPESFSSLPSTPQIVVSSGFYDWVEDDEIVKDSMRIVWDLLEPGGCFIFTNQSGHLDLEMVNEVFIDFRGESLKMKTRSADLVNGWAQALGFAIHETRVDNQGYYSVTLAHKPAGA
jgi:SAM-dependent methyltransferase